MKIRVFKNDFEIAKMDIQYDNMLFTKFDSVVFQTDEGHSFSVDAYKGEAIARVQTFADEVRIDIIDRKDEPK